MTSAPPGAELWVWFQDRVKERYCCKTLVNKPFAEHGHMTLSIIKIGDSAKINGF